MREADSLHDTSTRLAAAMARLRVHSFLALALVVWFASLMSYIVPALDVLKPGFEVSAIEVVLLAFAVLLFLQAARRSSDSPATMFWILIAGGFAFWLIGRLSGIVVSTDVNQSPGLLVDVLYLGYYACIIVAVELRFEARNNPLWSLNYGTSAATGVFLLAAVYSYFSLVPYVAGRTDYESYFVLYAALDLYLTLRLTVAAFQSQESSWSRVYSALAFTFLLVAIADALSWLYRAGYLDFRRESMINLVWNLWCPAAYIASRVNLKVSGSSASLIERLYPAANTLSLFGLALPVVHLAGYGFGILTPDAVTVRTVFVFFWIIVVGSILMFFHRMMRTRIIELTAKSGSAQTKADDLEQQLERTLVMGTLGRLSAGLAHDFGNTISAISMHAKAIEDTPNKGDIEQRDIEGVGLGVRYAQDLVDKLRVFGSASSRMSAGPIDIALEARNTLQLVRPSLSSAVILKFGGTAARALALAEKADVHRVLTNYLYNAIDAVGDGGEISVDVREGRVHAECASCGKFYSGQYVTLSVCDSGPGIDPILAGNIFEPLVTSKPMGAGGGLGLATVHGIVHRVGGHVGLNFSADDGCCFTASFVSADTKTN